MIGFKRRTTYPASILDFRPVIRPDSGSVTEKDMTAEPSLRDLVYKYYGEFFNDETAIDYAGQYLDQIVRKINGA